METLNSYLNSLTKKFNNHSDSMRKDSILQNFYNSKLHKAEKGEEVRNVNEPYHPITNPQGYKGNPPIDGRPTVENAKLMKNRIALNQAKAQQQGPQLRVYDESKSLQGKKIYD